MNPRPSLRKMGKGLIQTPLANEEHSTYRLVMLCLEKSGGAPCSFSLSVEKKSSKLKKKIYI